MKIETERLIITQLTPEMAQAVHENSLDEDNRRFVPDEVFETLEDAQEAVAFLMSQYGKAEGPLVYPLIAKDKGANIGYVQMVPLKDGKWELGYHIAKKYTGKGYATEAVKAFLPVMAEEMGVDEIYGICLKANEASARIMEKCGFENLFTGIGSYQGKEIEIIRSVWHPPVYENAYFAGGCFWCITPTFAQMEGVRSVTAGYCGGDEENPVYEDVKHQLTHHRETIRVEFDPEKVSYETLLGIYLATVDLSDSEGQFIDKGFSYTLAVYYQTEEERAIVVRALAQLEEEIGFAPCVAVEKYKKFYDAEEYHQDYYLKNPEAFEKEMIESGRKLKEEDHDR